MKLTLYRESHSWDSLKPGGHTYWLAFLALLPLLMVPLFPLIFKENAPEWTYSMAKFPLFLFGLAVLYERVWKLRAGILIGKRDLRIGHMFEVLLALLFTAWYLSGHHIRYVDDTGFILRYLDNFREGCFYCFNPEDGPVFGISSFAYGIFTGFWTWTGLLSPESAVALATGLGLFVSAWLILRIFRHVCGENATPLLFLALCVLGGRALIFIGSSGMEAPMHLAICLGAVWFWLSGNAKWMWIFLALAVISKLDAVPLAMVLGLAHLIEHRKSFRPLSLKNTYYRYPLLYSLLPLVIFAVFAELVFGSPLPQSAASKLYLHPHPDDHWFPFLDAYLDSLYSAVMFFGFLAVYGLHWVILLSEGTRKWRNIVPGIGFFGVMGLYYIYNPAEPMLWYFVMPEALMWVQVGLSLQALLSPYRGRTKLFAPAMILFLVIVVGSGRLKQEWHWFDDYVSRVETERIDIGRFLKKHGGEKQTLVSGHGLISRPFPGYVIDQAGLNSRHGRDLEQLVTQFQPDWVVQHADRYTAAIMSRTGYRVDTAFYNITLYGSPTWRVWRRADEQPAHRLHILDIKDIDGDDLTRNLITGNLWRLVGKSYRFQLPDDIPEPEMVSFGTYLKHYPFNWVVTETLGDSVVAETQFHVPVQGEGWQRTHETRYRVQAPAGTGLPHYIRVQADSLNDKIEIVDPVLLANIL